MFKQFAAVIITVLALVNSCTSSSQPAIDPNPEVPNDTGPGFSGITTYLPYVEEVIIPEFIYAGEEFTITQRFSFPLRPEIGTEGYHHLMSHGYAETDSLVGYELDNWLYPNPLDAPRGNVFSKTMPALPEGTWLLRIWSAKSPANGGVSGHYQITPYATPLNRDAMTFTDYTITVVPRP